MAKLARTPPPPKSLAVPGPCFKRDSGPPCLVAKRLRTHSMGRAERPKCHTIRLPPVPPLYRRVALLPSHQGNVFDRKCLVPKRFFRFWRQKPYKLLQCGEKHLQANRFITASYSLIFTRVYDLPGKTTETQTFGFD